MGRYRIYVDEMVGILEDKPLVNTGENEVAEIWYGEDGLSRILLHFDVDDYVSKVSSGYVPSVTSTTVTTQLVVHDITPSYEIKYGSTSAATSFDTDVNLVDTPWDGGIGHDYIGITSTKNGFANWYSATSTSAWTVAGGDFSTKMFTQHYDKGNEDLSATCIDTSSMWAMITGTNKGLIITYSSSTEALSADSKTIKKFYSHNARTEYKAPYIELSWDNAIVDERWNMYPGGDNKNIYIFFTQNGQLKNPYSVTGVTFTSDLVGFATTSLTTIYNPFVGVYYVKYSCPTVPSGTTIVDTWAVDYSGNEEYENVPIGFVTQTSDISWDSLTITTSPFDSNNYIIHMPQLRAEYVKGDNIYLPIDVRVKYSSTIDILKNMEYQLELIDGSEVSIMVPWERVSHSHLQNFILIDTSWLIRNQEYQIKVRYYDGAGLVHNIDTKKRKFKLV